MFILIIAVNYPMIRPIKFDVEVNYQTGLDGE